MTKDDFIKICNDHKFWQWIKNGSPTVYSIVSDKKDFLKKLYKTIENRTYYPNPPREYITINKGSGVLRVTPALKIEDLCVYYYCARKLERYIALNRTTGTYGGYGLSGKLRHIEEKEFALIKDSNIIEIDDKKYIFSEIYGGYPSLISLNNRGWIAEWGDFTDKLYFNYIDYKDGFVAELDISNYYDSIQLDNLEYKLRKYVPHNCNDVIYLVIHFLRFWNRHINFYRQQGAGIPQDTFGECSRILANFYLQSYDSKISTFCKKKGASFFRYADDQIIFAKSKEELEEIIAKASSFLMREGLNFNQKKVKIMNIKEFQKQYAFKNFVELSNDKPQNINPKILEKQISFYLKNKKFLKKEGLSLLRRILGVLGDMPRKPKNIKTLKKYLILEFMPSNYCLSVSDLNRIYKILDKKEKGKMIKIMNNHINSSWYTDHLYNLRAFYKINKIKNKDIKTRITFIKKFYGFEKV